MPTEVQTFYSSSRTSTTPATRYAHSPPFVDDLLSKYQSSLYGAPVAVAAATATATTSATATNGPAATSSSSSATLSPSLSSLSHRAVSSSAAKRAVVKRVSVVRRLVDRVRLEYYRYEVTFGLYVMSPGEKLVANGFVAVVVALLAWALLVYMPPLLYHKLSRLVWLLTGHSGDSAAAAQPLVWPVSVFNSSLRHMLDARPLIHVR
jgi:hypothetical protein